MACQTRIFTGNSLDINKIIFLIWIEKVWKPSFTREKQSSYLTMDEFSVHMMSNCVREIQNCDTEVDSVVGGYTSKLQVLDVDVKKNIQGLHQGML